MFSRIIIGVDGDTGGADALSLATRLASPDTELVAVAVAVIADDLASGPHFDREGAERQATAGQLSGVRGQEGVACLTVTAPSVAAGLHAAVERTDADLIVVGSSRRGTVGRLFAGDDTRATLRGAPCPVGVAPVDYARSDTPITQIGLGWNGRPEGDRALELAKVLGADLGARVHALAVVERPGWPGGGDVPTAELVEVDLAAMRGRAATVEGVETTIVTGKTVEELKRFAAEVDLLVVGSQQLGPVARVLLGSTSEHLTHGGVRPLLVVPHAARPIRAVA